MRAQALVRQGGPSKATVLTDIADYARVNAKKSAAPNPYGLITSLILRRAAILQSAEATLTLAIAQTQVEIIIELARGEPKVPIR